MVKTLGGRVTGTVSSKTNCLILGEVLEDGRSTESGSKCKRAVTEPNVTLSRGASQFFGLLQQHSDRQTALGIKPTKPVTVAKAAPAATAAAAAAKSDPTPAASINPYAKADRNPYAKTTTISATPTATANPYASSSRSTSSDAHADLDNRKMPARPTNTLSKSSGTNSNTNQLWVDKYKPTQSAETGQSRRGAQVVVMVGLVGRQVCHGRLDQGQVLFVAQWTLEGRTIVGTTRNWE
jgi:hypothetical protein